MAPREVQILFLLSSIELGFKKKYLSLSLYIYRYISLQQQPSLLGTLYCSLPVAKGDPQESWRGTFKILFLLYIITERMTYTLKCHLTECFITRGKLNAHITLLILLFLFYALELPPNNKKQIIHFSFSFCLLHAHSSTQICTDTQAGWEDWLWCEINWWHLGKLGRQRQNHHTRKTDTNQTLKTFSHSS